MRIKASEFLGSRTAPLNGVPTIGIVGEPDRADREFSGNISQRNDALRCYRFERFDASIPSKRFSHGNSPSAA
jgi:hypothetical protein